MVEGRKRPRGLGPVQYGELGAVEQGLPCGWRRTGRRPACHRRPCAAKALELLKITTRTSKAPPGLGIPGSANHPNNVDQVLSRPLRVCVPALLQARGIEGQGEIGMTSRRADGDLPNRKAHIRRVGRMPGFMESD